MPIYTIKNPNQKSLADVVAGAVGQLAPSIVPDPSGQAKAGLLEAQAKAAGTSQYKDQLEAEKILLQTNALKDLPGGIKFNPNADGTYGLDPGAAQSGLGKALVAGLGPGAIQNYLGGVNHSAEARRDQGYKLEQAERDAEYRLRERSMDPVVASPGSTVLFAPGDRRIPGAPAGAPNEPDTPPSNLARSMAGGVPSPSPTPPPLAGMVKEMEGFYPEAYPDNTQVSIGYGTRAKPGEKTISKEEAEARLSDELSTHVQRIDKAAEAMGVDLNPNQRDALASFDYNTGRGAEMVERFGGDFDAMQNVMGQYTKSAGKYLPGLAKRRGEEIERFNTPVPRAALAETVAGGPVVSGNSVTMPSRESQRDGRFVPANINTAISENMNSVRKIDSALNAIEGSPDSTGLLKGATNAIPGVGANILNALDPNGVDVRAIISDIGSMVIHDRSGAAVTVSEFPRLRPFVPVMGDSDDVIKKKLANFKNEYMNVLNDMGQVYSSEQGYQQNPALDKFLQGANPAQQEGDFLPEEQPESQGLPIGSQEGGYEFLGGDPSDKNNWRKL